uniref:Uncharacterized protein n=1 Tax=Chlamydomonas leiostraca TaxID=1034604 RepID=A0A7S0WVM7_9CHLO
MYNPWYTPLPMEDVEEASAAVMSLKADPQLLKVTQKLHQDQKQFLVSQRNSSKPVTRAAEATKAKDGQLCLVLGTALRVRNEHVLFVPDGREPDHIACERVRYYLQHTHTDAAIVRSWGKVPTNGREAADLIREHLAGAWEDARTWTENDVLLQTIAMTLAEAWQWSECAAEPSQFTTPKRTAHDIEMEDVTPTTRLPSPPPVPLTMVPDTPTKVARRSRTTDIDDCADWMARCRLT